VSKSSVSRREFLRVSALLAAGSLAAACVPPTAEPAPVSGEPASEPGGAAAPAAPAPSGTGYREAPILAERVQAGELPPIDERLPEDPLILTPIEEIGQYGGTWRRAFKGVSDYHAYGRVNYEPILRWPRNPQDPVQPGIASAWEFNEDGSAITLYMRKGIKWSDGAPFTVDDMIFWWEYVELDPELSINPHAEYLVNDKPMTLVKIDDYTITMQFDGPNGLILRMLAFHGNQWPLNFERFGCFVPKHYLEQFHPRLNSEVTDYTLFNEKADDYNPERPTLTPWPVTEWGASATRLVAKRNPYYWKVDTEGNQLPYIDEVRLDLVEDSEVINLKAMQGEIDMQTRGMDIKKFSLFKENEAANDFRTFLWQPGAGSHLVFFFNQSYTSDPVLQEIFQNAEFRKAMSYAIDRDTINEVGYLGLAEARSELVVEGSAYYQDDIKTLYTEYDPAKAEEILDGMGLTKGADGWRVRPDGKPLQILVETQETGSALDTIQIACENWQAIGVQADYRTMERSLYWTRATGNEVQVATWGTDRGLEPFVDPIYVFPFDERSWMGPAYGIWYKTKGAMGEEPPEHVKHAMALFDEFITTVDPDRQVEIGKELIRYTAERAWVVSTVGGSPAPVIVKNNFRNVPAENVSDWIFMTPGNLDPCHFFFKQ
jgi:peptide/nickel transport system substrate-binding protein